MKKLTMFILALLLTFTLAACGSNEAKVDKAIEKNDWETVVKEYEKWADDFLEFSKKLKDDPTNEKLLEEYEELIKSGEEWETKFEKLEDKLPEDEADKFMDKIEGIGKKILEEIMS